MKIYNYILFRLYDYYHRVRKEDAGLSLYFTVTASTLIIYFILYNTLTYVDFYFFKIVNQLLPNKFSIIVFMAIVGFINYWFFIKNRKFLNYNFKSDKKGGYTIIGFIVLLALTFIFIANKNRDKIFKEREKASIENMQKLD
jgi:amino acid transporter